MFWLGILLIYLLTAWVSSYSMESISLKELLPRFRSRFYNLLVCMVYSYIVVYYLLPRYLRNKNLFIFIVGLVALTLGAYLASAAIMYYNTVLFAKRTLLAAGWLVTMNFLFLGPPVICGLFLAGNMLKTYFDKIEERVSLVKENANAELQLLKAQVHPHFLFNTLNNIYSFTITKSPEAPMLVKKLSDMLNYMTNECEHPLVSLHQELKILNDYIDLEKVRYGSRLNLQVEIQGDARNKLIAPLLLIPFVENSFKHGSSKMLEHPWINLKIVIKAETLLFTLENSKPKDLPKLNGDNGIGLKNVQKRLKLLYPGGHHLCITIQENAYLVQLQLPLHASKETLPEPSLELQEI
ncbi:MAG TPA: histidine kinase, partial [Sphingobacteriaceae bacterium]